jgi:acetyltransferase
MDAVDSFSNLKTVAVIGASNTPGKIGNAIVNNLIKSGYKGKIYRSTRKKKNIGAAVLSFPGRCAGDIEMAIFCIPPGKPRKQPRSAAKKALKIWL